MKFLPTYHTMSFYDDVGKTDRDAFEEGVAYAKRKKESILMPCKDRIFEAGIIAAIIETMENTDNTER